MGILDEMGSRRKRCDATADEIDICFLGFPDLVFACAMKAIVMRMWSVRIWFGPHFEVLL